MSLCVAIDVDWVLWPSKLYMHVLSPLISSLVLQTEMQKKANKQYSALPSYLDGFAIFKSLHQI